MSVLSKILMFLVFLVTFIAWVILNFNLFKKLQKGLMKEKFLLIQESLMLMNILALFIFVWILSGFINFKLIGLFIIASQLGLIISGLLWMLVRTRKVEWVPLAAWAGFEFGIKYPLVIKASQIVGVLMIIGYPIFAAINYFRNNLPSIEATQGIFKTTLVFLFLLGWLLMLPVIIGSLLSENLDENTRARFIVVRIGTQISNALYLALILWAFGIASERYQYTIGDIKFTISPLVLIILFGFFVFAYFLPYIIGVRNGKIWRKYILEEKKKWIEKLLDVFSLPTPELYLEKLGHIKNAIINEKNEFIRKRKIVQIGQEFDQVKSLETTQSEIQYIFEVYTRARPLDQRFSYLDFLEDLLEQIKTSMEKLKTIAKEDEQIISRRYAENYREKKDDLEKLIDKKEKSNIPLLVGITFLGGPIVSQILSELGKLISNFFLKLVQ